MSASGSNQGLRAGVCLSTTRPAAPYDGQVIYETDTDKTLVWNGSAWVYLSTSRANPVGFDLVKTVSFTTSSQVDVTDCFSSTYDNYRVQLEWLQNTTAGEVTLKMRDSSGVVSTNYGFTSGGSYYSSGTGTFAGFNDSANETQTSGYVLSASATHRAGGSWDVFGPNLSRETNWIGQVFVSTTANTSLTRIHLLSRIRHTSATVCTGFSLIPSAGTMTGTVRVYGYVNS